MSRRVTRSDETLVARLLVDDDSTRLVSRLKVTSWSECMQKKWTMIQNYEVPLTVDQYQPLINKATTGNLLNYIIYCK